MRVGYFEGFNFDRPCLNEDILDIDYTQYTHIHLGFATITPDFDIDITSISNQFDMFLALPDVKRVLKIGGWAFSTDPSTYDIFRQAVQAENPGIIVPNIVAFVQKYGLDGVDIDWEYPGEPDIKGIPAGSPDDGGNYFIFLAELKNALAQETPGTTYPLLFQRHIGISRASQSMLYHMWSIISFT
jgi:GH18 family chitinase